MSEKIQRVLMSDDLQRACKGLMERLFKHNADIIDNAYEWVMEGLGWAEKREAVTPLMLAQAILNEAEAQDGHVERGESDKSFPPRLRRLAADIISIEGQRLRDMAPVEELSFDDMIERISMGLMHTGGHLLADMHNQICDEHKPVVYHEADACFKETDNDPGKQDIDTEEKQVAHCPFCGAGLNKIVVDMIEWSAQSLEPCDPENRCTLNEHQCSECHRSFWT